jgi:DNA (cytosine-5)-methyltransferase 1
VKITSYSSSYQVRFCFLQAAHYGTPQRRVRFFLIAAKEGHQLPEFPQPTHDYPEAKDHVIKYHDGEKQVRINPVRGTKGIARHPVVTIWDAIGDLPQFDWFVFYRFNIYPLKSQQGTPKPAIREPC